MKSVVDIEFKAFDKSDDVHFDIIKEIKHLKLPRIEMETMPTDQETYWFGTNDISDLDLEKTIKALKRMYKDQLIRGYKIVETKEDINHILLKKEVPQYHEHH